MVCYFYFICRKNYTSQEKTRHILINRYKHLINIYFKFYKILYIIRKKLNFNAFFYIFEIYKYLMMKIKLIFTGKTSFKYINDGIDIFEKRIKHFIDFEIITIPDLKNTKNLKSEQIKIKEGELILKKLDKKEFLILLDEKGKEFSSNGFAKFIEKKQIAGIKQVTFLIGGAYGFSKDIYNRANSLLSLSKMTYSHQIIRLFFAEQLYRAFAIINKLPYHNE